VEEARLTARAVYGFFPANARGDDIELYEDETRSRVRTVLHALRQQNDKPEGQPNQALSDFVAPVETGRPDYLGGFAVTTGIGIESLVGEFEKQHDDYSAIMAKALADRLAEAFTELVHKRARAEWGYGRDEQLAPDELIRERYRGIRPAPGYPACPDHSEKRALFDLLQVEENAGIPHPEARYFTVGRIGLDQVDDYRRRKGADQREIERWLAPVLDADAESAQVAP